ncbi:CDP-glycerol glycerophosphotransferase [Heyndrickxia sporothermodurans]|nr:CDP-glycerol glycerophosphotransferase [Heyndrickxia sporothermodurans]
MSRMKLSRKTIKRKLTFVLSPLKKYLIDKDFRKRAIYTKYLEGKPIRPKSIFYEAYHGESMTGNPYAVFKYLINHPEFKDYDHIWAIKDFSSIQNEFKRLPNVKFVKYQSISYVKTLATAKFLINDTTFPYYFIKRKEQIYANIWHGTPLKTMGLDIKNKGYADHKNIQRNFLFSDYMVNPNQFTYEKLLKSHDIHTLYNGKVLDTGYPRVDLMFSANTNGLKRKLSIPPNKKVILYAPTWRGKIGEEINESEKLLNDIRKIQDYVKDTYTVLLKSHYYANKFFNANGMNQSCIPNEMDTNELLAIVDILITDYSSIFFEFLPTEKPILFYAYDLEEYENTRGTYIAMNKLPGPLCKDVHEIVECIENIDSIKDTYRQTYQTFQRKFCYHDDGNATKRFVDTVFFEKPSEHLIKVGTDKTKLLIYGGGFLNNGITASVINLLNTIDYNLYDVTLIDYGGTPKEEKVNNLQKIKKDVHYIYRVGTWNATLSEWYRHALLLRRGLYTDFMKSIIPSKMYEREMKRMIGLSEFDIGIDFSGYSPFWATMFAFGHFKKKSIFLHSDMEKEIHKKVKNRYPHRKNLKVVFSLYDLFDKVLSVSKLTHEKNMESLKQYIHQYSKKMDYVINTIDYQNILSKKDHYQYEFAEENDFSLIETTEQTVQGFPLPNDSHINFINIGRLGPEKDHAKLIHSFSILEKNNPTIRLYIVGDGALREQLVEQVESLHLKEKVIFTGQLNNPYALLNKCDCFVLSSNQEGQPMVLLEALVLGKPVIVTDIPGSRSVIDGGYGLIVENSIEGLVGGMSDFIAGSQLNEKAFDYEAYREDAINMFYQKVCTMKN